MGINLIEKHAESVEVSEKSCWQKIQSEWGRIHGKVGK